ncbi:MAG: hypothetical protein V1847_00820 [Candidatus Diapherotrites archaeon]
MKWAKTVSEKKTKYILASSFGGRLAGLMIFLECRKIMKDPPKLIFRMEKNQFEKMVRSKNIDPNSMVLDVNGLFDSILPKILTDYKSMPKKLNPEEEFLQNEMVNIAKMSLEEFEEQNQF